MHVREEGRGSGGGGLVCFEYLCANECEGFGLIIKGLGIGVCNQFPNVSILLQGTFTKVGST